MYKSRSLVLTEMIFGMVPIQINNKVNYPKAFHNCINIAYILYLIDEDGFIIYFYFFFPPSTVVAIP